ncbi:hypothetical protein [Acuticoccus yangtzensis]|uniref:hypothetical protein n=1 Tax=Acuticoccus yangtzensis TaxID=1443441 RepID=UPI00094956AB|nr:hypothetical protein [Acuticoccus yangtzensis]
MTDLAKLRASNHALQSLPETIRVPVQPPARAEPIAKPLADATVDELAFSLTIAEDELSAASDRLHALRRLLRLAREAGAIGTDRPADIVTGGR